jgi:hypothetical protein
MYRWECQKFAKAAQLTKEFLGDREKFEIGAKMSLKICPF